MSALGDYVHLNQQNYVRYGINRRGDTPSESWEAAASALRSTLDVSSEIGSLMAEAQQLENQYNELFYPAQKGSNESSAFISALEQAGQEVLNEEFGLMAGKFNVSNLSVDKTAQYDELKAAIDRTKTSLKNVKLTKDSSLRGMRSGVNKILARLDELDQNTFTASAVQSRLKEARAEAEGIKKELSQLAKNGTKGKFTYDMKEKDINTLNNIIRDFGRVHLWYDQAGALFEWLLPLVGINLSGMGKDALAETLKGIATDSSIVQGNVTIKVQIPDLLNNDLIDVNIEDGNVQMKTISTRSKTDVVVSYTDDSSDELQTTNVSAKNISERNIKLVQDTTLYRILALSGAYSFGTHYLNVVSTYGDGDNSMAQILEANRLVKGLALKLGAEGFATAENVTQKGTESTADLLVVNDRNESHIYVYNLKALVYLIQQGMTEGRYTNIVTGLSDTFTISQTKADTPEHRIQKLLTTINGVKITAELGGSALNQYLSLLKS